MAYQIVYPQLAEALYLALKEDGFYQAMEASVAGDNKAKHQAMLAYMDYSIVEAKEFGRCFIPEQHYGVSVWSVPISAEQQAKKSAAKKEFIRENMGEQSAEAYLRMCEFMSEQAKGLVAESDWYLSIIGIGPEFQGQGLGPGLIEETLNQADQAGVCSYLETFTPRNMTFYRRLGYETVGEFLEPHSNATYWVMRRQPRS